MEQEGIRFVCNASVGDNVEAQLLLRDFDATVLCTGATQPRDLADRGPRTRRACTSRWITSRQHQGAARRRARREPDSRPRQGRGRHRRRRHRHRLRRHGDAPRLPQPGADRDPAAAAAGARGGQSLAGVAEGLQAGLRPGGSRGEVRRRPARVPHDREEVRRRRERAGSKAVVTVQVEVGEATTSGQFVPVEVPGTEKTRPAQLVLLAMGFLGPGAIAARGARASRATRAATSRPSTESTRRA